MVNVPGPLSCLRHAYWVALAAVFVGCGGSTLLLEKGHFSSYPPSPDNENRIIYFDQTFTFAPDGALYQTTYEVIRVGENPASFPKVLAFEDGGGKQLLTCEARVNHTNGSVERFLRDDFFTFNLSDAAVISKQSIKSVPIREKLATGDLIESASYHRLLDPEAGIEFDLSSLGMPADSVSCTIVLRPSDSLRYVLANSAISPIIRDSTTGRIYTFSWPPSKPVLRRRQMLQKVNSSPRVMAVLSQQSWRSLGDWYLQLAAPNLRPGPAVASLARKITEGRSKPLEKMAAIFQYCISNIRYEQVYLEHGELVPNPVDLTMSRGFGDCKDYASLMYAMARSVGVKADLALCYRGRGVEFFPMIPRWQFNHIILHVEDEGRHYWYDGTDRAGQPGVTSFDLVNAPALVLDSANSHLVTIAEAAGNRLAVSGALSMRGSSLAGTLQTTLTGQYAVDFFWLEHQSNTVSMRSFLNESLKGILNEKITVDSIHWTHEGSSFVITSECELPNCVTNLQGASFVSIAALFPQLLPERVEENERSKVFFFPYFPKVALDLHLSDAMLLPLPDKDPHQLVFGYDLPPGPFSPESRDAFVAQLNAVIDSAHVQHKIGKDPRP